MREYKQRERGIEAPHLVRELDGPMADARILTLTRSARRRAAAQSVRCAGSNSGTPRWEVLVVHASSVPSFRRGLPVFWRVGTTGTCGFAAAMKGDVDR